MIRLSVSSSLCQYITPRLMAVPCQSGVKIHFCAPVAASTAKSFNCGDVPYNTPSTTMGSHWICDRLLVSRSCVLYCQATFNCDTLSVLICCSDEYLFP